MAKTSFRNHVVGRKFRLLSFAIFTFNTASAQQSFTMTIKITPKHPDLLADTSMQVWFKGDITKVSFSAQATYDIGIESPQDSLSATKVTKEHQSNDSVNSMFYIHNLKTGMAYEVVYSPKNSLVWKRTENNKANLIDSTRKFFLDEKKLIAGHLCQKVVLENKYTKKRDTIFAATDLKNIKNPFFLYLNLFPMYFSDGNSVFEVSKITLTPLDDEIFALPPNSKIFTEYSEWIKNFSQH